ncbi:unnamed protein product [Spirodela intermedia]|uniref:Uncharacterized protein n=1 Tax=Spirodela intermedia TaxID=51605 RepID=A0A7I8J4K7_SPIIN|nr:unnamed protein product [Spirodela intermedia]CAA6664300.1 unnamed protein product [Spirodela intermedia]
MIDQRDKNPPQQIKKQTMLEKSNPARSLKQTNFNINLKEGVFHIRCSAQNILGLITKILKMKYFPLTLKEKAKEWYRSLEVFFEFYPLGKTNASRREIQNFSQMYDESFSEAWEIDSAARGCFYHAYEDEVYVLMEKMAESNIQHAGVRQNRRTMNRRQGGILNDARKEDEVERDQTNHSLWETNKKLDELTSALNKVLNSNSPLIKTKICSLCHSRDHEDGACKEKEEVTAMGITKGNEVGKGTKQVQATTVAQGSISAEDKLLPSTTSTAISSSTSLSTSTSSSCSKF